MRSRMGRVFMLGVAGALACGGGNKDGGGDNTITISGFAFSPTNLTVAAGATVTANNTDSAAHTITSEATAGSFTPGAVDGISFDTDFFTGSKTFTIPSSAKSGTVIPYYCQAHQGMMKNLATITIK